MSRSFPVCRRVKPNPLFSPPLALALLTLPQRPPPSLHAQLGRATSPAQGEGVDGHAQGAPPDGGPQGGDLGRVREQGGALMSLLVTAVWRLGSLEQRGGR